MPKKTKIRQSAKGEQCTVRIPGICNWNPETVVLAHLNGGGMGMKNPDYQGAYCCSACHEVLDGRVDIRVRGINGKETPIFSKGELKRMHLEGVIRTQEILRKKGLIKVD